MGQAYDERAIPSVPTVWKNALTKNIEELGNAVRQANDLINIERQRMEIEKAKMQSRIDGLSAMRDHFERLLSKYEKELGGNG